ncbi:MAG: hypothetical protein M3134_00490 [Actinomycetota bacterium]|nr:hypothetical protein [Actinomycetota bacterium]
MTGAIGGLAVKAADVAYQEVQRRREKRVSVEEFVQTQLDPLLKAADELVGKVYSLASEDFKTIPRALDPQDRRTHENLNLANVLYLFAQFWATVEILRRESIYVRLAESPSGKKLTSFLDCLESRPVRMVVRARQRALGELLIVADREKLRPMGFSEFVTALAGTTDLGEWLGPLEDLVIRAKHGSRSARQATIQRLLQYALVVHALVDNLDPGHTTTSTRPPMTSKISPRTAKALRYRVFPVYLPFVEQSQRYWRHQSGK